MEHEQTTDIVCRAYGLIVRSIDEASRSIVVVASTSALDSYDEIVEQDWDLARYARNPVVLWCHDSREFPIGTASNVGTASGNLEATITFASKEANEDAEKAWLLAKERVLRGVSVGFRSHDKRWETRDGREVYVMRKNELYEISMVPVPANPDGLMRQKAADLQVFKAGSVSAESNVTKMDEKLQAELVAKAAELATKTAEVTSLTERATTAERELATANTAIKTLEERAAGAEKRLAEIESKSAKADVAALVGKKITPDQEDDYLEMRTTWGAEKFEKFVGKMPELKLTVSVIPADQSPNTATRSGGKPSKLLAGASKAAHAAGERS